MPSRILREGINSSARILALSPGAEILYRRLMSVVDDYGRYHAAPQTVLAGCWPTMPDKVCLQDVSKWLTECTQGARPLITLYQHDGAMYLQVTDFNQTIRTKSKFPEPVNNLQATCEQNVGTIRSSEFGVRDSVFVSRESGEAPPPTPAPRYEPLDEAIGPDLVARTIHQLFQQHAEAGFVAGDLPTASAKLAIILGKCGPNCGNVANSILAAHLKFVPHWKAENRAPRLQWWLQGEEYLHPPSDATTGTLDGKKRHSTFEDERAKRVLANMEAKGL